MDSTPELHARWLGREAFEACLERQLALREAVLEGSAPDTLLLVEHPATVTLGRRATRADLLWSDEELEARDVAVAQTPRGGEATLHAPGQLVAYPIVRVGRAIRAHVVMLAETTIELVESMGVEGAEFRMDHPGVWVGERKLASIGIHVSRGVTVQGLSLNVDVASELFGALVSCGLPEVQMVSLKALTPAPPPPLPELAQQWAERWATRRGQRWAWSDASDEG